MKRIAITLGLVAALAAIPPQAKTQEAPNVHPLVICGAALVIIAGGVVVVKGVVALCKNIESNQNWQATNGLPADGWKTIPVPIDASANPSAPIHIQSASAIGSAWVDDVLVSISQVGGQAIAVAYNTNGVPLLTNSAPIDSTGWATLDMRALKTTNPSPSRFYRLAQ